ncbi:MAG: heme exporter protein CcmB [Pseudomonadota bacterium]|nr:heme exporter protein CcmB [Pseudomonadota bacterium]
MRALPALFLRELSLAWGGGGGPLLAVGFYAAVIGLTPLAAGAQSERLAVVAPGMAWLVLVLASLLSLERVFEPDFEDGGLDLLALGGAPLPAVAAVKAAAHWLATTAPLSFLAPLAAVSLGAEPRLLGPVFLAALLGGSAFSFVGAVGAALALGARRGGLLIAVLVLPLLAPPVVFGAAAVEAAAAGAAWLPSLALLGAYAAAALALCPFAAAAAIRSALG